MAIYKVSGSYEEFFEAIIEADSADIAQQIFYQNASDMTVIDSNWTDIHIEDEYQDEEELESYGESIEYTMDNYQENGPKTSV
jgi:hypothetical protein